MVHFLLQGSPGSRGSLGVRGPKGRRVSKTQAPIIFDNLLCYHTYVSNKPLIACQACVGQALCVVLCIFLFINQNFGSWKSLLLGNDFMGE